MSAIDGIAIFLSILLILLRILAGIFCRRRF